MLSLERGIRQYNSQNIMCKYSNRIMSVTLNFEGVYLNYYHHLFEYSRSFVLIGWHGLFLGVGGLRLHTRRGSMTLAIIQVFNSL